jgi:NADPH:quinone reductase-like Zn-dependent oxidoreductase
LKKEWAVKAVVLRELGEPENLILTDVPDPTPGPGEAVVRLKAAALNHRDVWIRRGQYAKIQLPAILGSDGAGVVEAVGEGVASSWVGQAVVIDPSMGWGDDDRVQGKDFRILGMPDEGTYAQYVKVPAQNLHAKPAHLSDEEAAALPLAGVTAYRAVITRGEVRSGDLVLVTGIGGGVSSFALPIAVTQGAQVFVTSGSDDKIALAKSHGAAGGVNYRSADWEKEMLTLTGGRRFDAVIDSVGGETFTKALGLLRPGGRIVTYGATTGAVKEFLLQRIFWNQLDVRGTTMGSPRDFAGLLKLFTDHHLRPTVDHVYPLAEVAEAHRRMEAAGQAGKLVLAIP